MGCLSLNQSAHGGPHDPNAPITVNLMTPPSNARLPLPLSYGNTGVWLMAGMQQPFWQHEAQPPESEADPQNQTKPQGSQQARGGGFLVKAAWKAAHVSEFKLCKPIYAILFRVSLSTFSMYCAIQSNLNWRIKSEGAVSKTLSELRHWKSCREKSLL